ncbi:MAG: NRDE family protein [Bacteroidota bacterium]
MCLISFAWQQDKQYPLILAANRDEFYERPTQRAHWWEDHPHIFAGRDLKGGGTWMGANAKGYWAALTNYREVPGFMPDAPSRGPLVSDYLRDSPDPEAYLKQLEEHADVYNGFNLLLGTPDAVWYFANREAVKPQKLAPGFYGLSNQILDTPWPKVVGVKDAMETIVPRSGPDKEALFGMLQNREIAPDDALPQTGVSLEWERMLSARFIQSEAYGTRVSTFMRLDQDAQLYVEERAYVPEGAPVYANIQPNNITA